MTPRTFWTIFIKILGVWLVLDSLTLTWQFISSFFFLFKEPDESFYGLILTVSVLVLTLGTYILILRYCLFKTEWVIDKLNLDKGFIEEKFELNIHRSTVLQISAIVIGGLIIIDSLPLLCKQILSYFQQKNFSGESENPITASILFHFIKTFIGYFLIANNRIVVNFIEKQRKKSN